MKGLLIWIIYFVNKLKAFCIIYIGFYRVNRPIALGIVFLYYLITHIFSLLFGCSGHQMKLYFHCCTQILLIILLLYGIKLLSNFSIA